MAVNVVSNYRDLSLGGYQAFRQRAVESMQRIRRLPGRRTQQVSQRRETAWARGHYPPDILRLIADHLPMDEYQDRFYFASANSSTYDALRSLNNRALYLNMEYSAQRWLEQRREECETGVSVHLQSLRNVIINLNVNGGDARVSADSTVTILAFLAIRHTSLTSLRIDGAGMEWEDTFPLFQSELRGHKSMTVQFCLEDLVLFDCPKWLIRWLGTARSTLDFVFLSSVWDVSVAWEPNIRRYCLTTLLLFGAIVLIPRVNPNLFPNLVQLVISAGYLHLPSENSLKATETNLQLLRNTPKLQKLHLDLLPGVPDKFFEYLATHQDLYEFRFICREGASLLRQNDICSASVNIQTLHRLTVLGITWSDFVDNSFSLPSQVMTLSLFVSLQGDRSADVDLHTLFRRPSSALKKVHILFVGSQWSGGEDHIYLQRVESWVDPFTRRKDMKNGPSREVKVKFDRLVHRTRSRVAGDGS